MRPAVVLLLIVGGLFWMRPSAPSPVPPAPKVTVVLAVPIVVPIPIAAPVAAAPPTVLAAVPFIQAQCLAVQDEPPPSCAWDDGFPAISRDGTTIAVKHTGEDGGRGNPNLRIELFDVATNKRLRSVTILTGDEYDRWDALKATVAARAAKLNAQLDGYRTLQNIEATSTLELEQQDALVRVVDTETHRAIYQRDFDAAVVYPNHKSDPDRECSGLSQIGGIDAWWDAGTRTLVTSVMYAYGGCLCGEQTDTFVKRL